MNHSKNELSSFKDIEKTVHEKKAIEFEKSKIITGYEEIIVYILLSIFAIILIMICIKSTKNMLMEKKAESALRV